MKNKYPHKVGRFLVNFPLGLFVGAEFVLLVAWLVDADLVDADSDFWKAAGLLFGALITPIIVVAVNFFQQAEQGEREEETRRNRLAAAKANLPAALSEFSHVCAARMQRLVGPGEDVKAEELEVSKETLAAIQACIEFERGELQTRLAEILMIYQILISRSKSREKERQTKCFNDPDGAHLPKHDAINEELHHSRHIGQWASFRGVVEVHFDYARGMSDSVHREDVKEYAYRYMNNLSDSRGIVLTNNPTFRKWLEHREDKDFFFTDISWKLKMLT